MDRPHEREGKGLDVGEWRRAASAIAHWAGFDGADEASQVHSASNGAACAAADPRGLGDNWEVLSCDATQSYVYEMATGSVAGDGAYSGDVFPVESSATATRRTTTTSAAPSAATGV